jgi:predicted dehydrogenase
MTAVRIGFVGAGGRTGRELLDLIQIPDAEVVALCDLDVGRCEQTLESIRQRAAQAAAGQNNQAKESAARRAAELHPAIYGDVHRLLEGSELDAVYVSLPPFAHGLVEHAILDAKKHLFVEKPLAIEVGTAREIEDHVRQAGIITSVGYQMRYGAGVQAARERLQGVPIGLAIAVRIGGLPRTLWWRVQDRSGGMLIEQHTHGVDVMRYLVGEVETVSAFGATRLLTDVPDLDIFDVNSVSLRFENGAVGSIVNSCALQPGQAAPGTPGLAGSVHILAKGQSLTVSSARLVVDLPGGQREEVVDEGDPNLAMNRAFVHAVQTGNRSGILSDYSDGLRTLALTAACQASAEQQRPIEVKSHS